MTSLDLTFFLALSPQPRHPEKLRFSFQPGLHGFLCQSQGGYVYEGPEMSEMFSRVWEGPEAAGRAPKQRNARCRWTPDKDQGPGTQMNEGV